MQEKQESKRRFTRRIAAWPAWVKFHRSAKYLKGRTRDVSRGGAYVVLPAASDGQAGEVGRVGDVVDFILEVPTEPGEQYAVKPLNGRAEIVRVEDGKGGLAIRFSDEKNIP